MENQTEIICEKRTYTKKTKLHAHDYGQMLFPLKGSMNLKIKEQFITLHEKNLLYIPPTVQHHFYSINANEFLVVDIPTIYLPGTNNVFEDAGILYDFDSYWQSIRYLLLEESEKKSATSMSHLVTYIANKLESQPFPSLQYIQTHYKEAITINQLAQLENYHPVYYTEWFKKQLGVSPTTYIQQLRIKEAIRLLTTTGWKINRIAQEIGYHHSSSFIRIFQQEVGISPSLYREQLKNANK